MEHRRPAPLDVETASIGRARHALDGKLRRSLAARNLRRPRESGLEFSFESAAGKRPLAGDA
jgi:hypothetical protein